MSRRAQIVLASLLLCTMNAAAQTAEEFAAIFTSNGMARIARYSHASRNDQATIAFAIESTMRVGDDAHEGLGVYQISDAVMRAADKKSIGAIIVKDVAQARAMGAKYFLSIRAQGKLTAAPEKTVDVQVLTASVDLIDAASNSGVWSSGALSSGSRRCLECDGAECLIGSVMRTTDGSIRSALSQARMRHGLRKAARGVQDALKSLLP